VGADRIRSTDSYIPRQVLYKTYPSATFLNSIPLFIVHSLLCSAFLLSSSFLFLFFFLFFFSVSVCSSTKKVLFYPFLQCLSISSLSLSLPSPPSSKAAPLLRPTPRLLMLPLPLVPRQKWPIFTRWFILTAKSMPPPWSDCTSSTRLLS